MRAFSWTAALAALAAVRVAIPLGVLAASGHDPGVFPQVDYDAAAGCRPAGEAREPWTGDACAYYSTARAIVAGWRELGAASLAIVLLSLVAAAWLGVRLWRARPGRRPWVVAAAALVVALVAAAPITQIDGSPAGAVGWPLLWSVPLLPLRAVDAAGPAGAFAVGLALSLVANVATLVATAFIGLYASGRRAVGLLAAALYALWPLLVVAVGGTQSWQNGTWTVETGLHLYTEPVSTACVAIGAAAALTPRPTPLRLVLAGLAFGYAVAARPTNIVAGLVVLVLLAVHYGRPAAVRYLAGALAVAPVVIAFLPKRTGYDLRPVADESGALFGARYVDDAWLDSLLWHPRALAILVPLAVVGALLLPRRFAALLLAGWALSNAVVYSFVRATPDHPRYLFASLPAALVLWSASILVVRRWPLRLRRRYHHAPCRPLS
jgi:hypothetical protein